MGNSFITAANLAQFQKETFIQYTSTNLRGVKVQLGIFADGKYGVITSSFKQPNTTIKFNNPQEAIDKYTEYSKSMLNPIKVLLVLIFALTATIGTAQVNTPCSPNISAQTETIEPYKVIRDTIKTNLVISITGSPALIVTEGYVIRERIKFGESWVMRANGLFHIDTGYLNENKKPFPKNTLVWVSKFSE